MDVGYFSYDDLCESGSPPPSRPKTECGTDADKSFEKVLGGGYTLQSRGRGGGDWGIFGYSKRDTIRSTGGILDTEAMVTTYNKDTATPLPYRFREGF